MRYIFGRQEQAAAAAFIEAVYLISLLSLLEVQLPCLHVTNW
jgi:hypothetical protein